MWELSQKGLKNRVLRPLYEEAVCQAHEKLFPGEGVCWEEVFFQRESNTNYRALRLPDLACCQDPEGGEALMDCACEGVYSRAEQACGE
jgi:hypothetical protein